MNIRNALCLSAIVLGLGSFGANAATLTATSLGLGNGSFTIDFDDNNSNGLFDLDELTSFSGFTSVFGQTIVSVLSVPSILGISNYGVQPGADLNNLYSDITWWNFEQQGSVNLTWDLASSPGNWTYSVSNISPVPLPGALPLFGAGLVALGFLKSKRRNKTKSLSVS